MELASVYLTGSAGFVTGSSRLGAVEGGGNRGAGRWQVKMKTGLRLRGSIVRGSRRVAVAAATSTLDPGVEDSSKKESMKLYGQIERVIVDTAKQSTGFHEYLGRWEEIQGAWVLRPSKGEPTAVVHFIGGVFVGATPQLTYRLFLERLCERGLLIIATPFASGFDHIKIADEAQFKFDRCLRVLRDNLGSKSSTFDPSDSASHSDYELTCAGWIGGATLWIETLPVFGVGHSLGALTHLLIGARYAVQRKGNVIISFNNKEASSAIPLLTPVVAPMKQNFGPILAQIIESPSIRQGAELALKQLEAMSPPMLKQILPLVEQLPPLYVDLAKGKDQFVPSPEETYRLIKSYYGVGRNLLVKFKDDSIDETPRLAQELMSSRSAISSFLDVSVRVLPGDHSRPLLQIFPEIPPGMMETVNMGSDLLNNLTAGTPFSDMAKGLGSNPTALRLKQEVINNIDLLVDEIAIWISASIKVDYRP